MKRALAAALAALVFAAQCAAAFAADGAKVSVVVRDARTRRPLQAVVALQGPLKTADFADESGGVTFLSVPSGSYVVRAAKAGYKTAVSRAFDVDANGTTIVDVEMVPAVSLKEISRITVRAGAPRGGTAVDENTGLRRLSTGLEETLGKIPGLSLTDDRTPGGALTLSLEGHDASQTAMSLDGVPLTIPGLAGNLNAVDSDLFSGAAVSFGASAGASAGSVSFKTLDPTLDWQNHLSAQYGSYGSSFLSMSEQGSSGEFGFAAQHTSRVHALAIDGDRYADASGLDYDHSAQTRTGGDLFKVRYHSGHTSISVMSLSSVRDSDAVCLQFTNVLPCGYGPGNTWKSTYDLTAMRGDLAVGSAAVTASVYGFHTADSLDMLRRYVGGAAQPLLSDDEYVTRGASLSGSMPMGARQSLSIAYSSNATNLHGRSLLASDSGAYAQSFHYQTFSAGDTVHASSKFQWIAGWSSSLVSTTGASALASLTAQLQPARGETLFLSGAAGSGMNQAGDIGTVSDPSSLVYNCASATATGYAPGDPISRNTLWGVRAGWSKEGAWGSLDAQAYTQTQRSATITALVNGTAFPSGFFDPAYLSAAQAIFDSSDYCNRAQSIGPANLYFSTAVSGVNLVYQGVRVHAAIPVSARAQVDPAVSLTRVTAWSHDPRLTDPRTLFRSGVQLRGVPELAGTLTFSLEPPRADGIEALADMRYVGWNNASGLPAFALFDLGFERRLQHGSVMLLVNNAFNSHAGSFITSASAQPLVTASGAQIAGLAVPNPPRQISVSYNVGVGRNADSSPSLRSSLGAGESADTSTVPGYLWVKWPLTRPLDPFKRNTASACTRGYAQLADTDVAAVRRYSQELEGYKKDGLYPAAAPIPPPSIPNFAVTYTSTGKTYTLRLESPKISPIQGLVACQEIHFGTPEQGRGSGVFVPQSVDFTRGRVYFAPNVGFYLIPINPGKGIVQKFRTYALPSHPPRDPFRESGADLCRSDLRPTADRLLSQLKAYFAHPDPQSGTTDDWTIVRHAAVDGKAWFELQSDQTATVMALLNCAYVAAAPAADLKKLGLSGAAPPAFNYNAGVGLYMLGGS